MKHLLLLSIPLLMCCSQEPRPFSLYKVQLELEGVPADATVTFTGNGRTLRTDHNGNLFDQLWFGTDKSRYEINVLKSTPKGWLRLKATMQMTSDGLIQCKGKTPTTFSCVTSLRGI